MAWTDQPDIIDDQDVFSPVPRKKSLGLDVFSPNIQASAPDAAGHYEPNTSRSNFHYTPKLGPDTSSLTTGIVNSQDPYSSRLNEIGNKLQDAYAPAHVPAWKQILGSVVGGFTKNPKLGGLITGETERQSRISPLMHQYELLSDIIAKNRAMQSASINDRLHNAQADYFEQKPELALAPKPTPEESAYQDLIKQGKHPLEAFEAIKNVKEAPAGKLSEEDKAVSDYMAANNLQDSPANRNKARIAVAQQKRPPQDEELKDISKQLKKAQLEKAMEPTVDEQRRADLARNMEENLSNLEDIAKRRPELFGPMAGRLTGVKQWFGTSDPDVAALKTIEEQTGMAMVGAHAMRNAQHVEKAAQSISGAYKTDAKALLDPNGPIAKARQSLTTFKSDEQRRRQAVTGGSINAPPPGAKIRDYTDVGSNP